MGGFSQEEAWASFLASVKTGVAEIKNHEVEVDCTALGPRTLLASACEIVGLSDRLVSVDDVTDAKAKAEPSHPPQRRLSAPT